MPNTTSVLFPDGGKRKAEDGRRAVLSGSVQALLLVAMLQVGLSKGQDIITTVAGEAS